MRLASKFASGAFVLGLLVVLLPPVLVVFALEREPLVTANAALLSQDVKDARALFKRYDLRLMTPGETTEVVATLGELNAAIAAGLSGFSPVKARVTSQGTELNMSATAALPVPENPIGRYLNLRVGLASSDSGLDISRVAIGALDVPPWLVRPALVFALDRVLAEGKGDVLLASVRSVSIAEDRVTVAFRPPEGLVADVKTAARRAIRVADSDSIRAYYQRLVELGDAFPPGQSVSLADFIGPLFTLAQTRSLSGDPVKENGALILALAMFFGDERFERLLSDVKTGALAGSTPDTDHVKIEARHDWVQHFITSAGLVLVAGGSGIANMLGEAKEIADTDGPEGFAFTDLAADRAGIRFAEIAIRSPEAARKLQSALAGAPRESDFFPPVADLPEGLNDAQFKRRYGDVNTEAYAAEVREVERRVASVALYR